MIELTFDATRAGVCEVKMPIRLDSKGDHSKMAEGVGFEPTVGLPQRLISSQVPSTTQPPFQPFIFKHLRLLYIVCYD